LIKMMRLNIIRISFNIAAACILFIGCTTNTDNAGIGETAYIPSKGLKESGNEKTLSVNLALNDTYCMETACVCVHEVAARGYEDVQKRLLDEFNIDLKITYFAEPYHMENELENKTFDGVICKPWTAFMLAKKNGLNYKRIADILDPFGNQWLTGLFLVKKESDIKSLSDINDKILVTGQQDAFEKYHSPMRILEKKGIKPGIIYDKASCVECLNELMDNKTDVALVSDYVMFASCAVDIANPEDFRTIGQTEKMPLTSVIIDFDRVSEADAIRFQKALLKISGKNSPETMLSEGFVKPAKWNPNPYEMK